MTTLAKRFQNVDLLRTAVIALLASLATYVASLESDERKGKRRRKEEKSMLSNLKASLQSWAYAVRLGLSGNVPRQSGSNQYAGPIAAAQKLVPWNDGKTFRHSSPITLFKLAKSENLRGIVMLEKNRIYNMLQHPDDWLYAGLLTHVRTQQQLGDAMKSMEEKFQKVGEAETDLVLIGGGHSHVHVLLMLAMEPIKKTRVTLISKDVMTPYSGMLPGHVGGVYSKDDSHLDLLRLAKFARIRFVVGEVSRIDFKRKQIHFKPTGMSCRPSQRFDVCSINAGSIPTFGNVDTSAFTTTSSGSVASSSKLTPVKPIDKFSEVWKELIGESTADVKKHRILVPENASSYSYRYAPLESTAHAKSFGVFGAALQQEEAAYRSQSKKCSLEEKHKNSKILIVGGGPAGVEIAFAVQSRLKSASVMILHAGKSVLSNSHGEAAQNLVAEVLKEKNIAFHVNAQISKVEETKEGRIVAITATGERYEGTQILWCTGGVAPGFLSESCKMDGVSSHEGSIYVNQSMQSLSHPDIFAAGDCCTIRGYESRPKAGVFAVMSGMTLSQNLKLYIEGMQKHKATRDGKSSSGSAEKGSSGNTSTSSTAVPCIKLNEYTPQSLWLALLNVCDGTAIASRGDDLALRSDWLFQLKDWIDRKWMHRYMRDGLPSMKPIVTFPEPFEKGGRPRIDHYLKRVDLGKDFDESTPQKKDDDGTVPMHCGGCGCKLGPEVLKQSLNEAFDDSVASTVASPQLGGSAASSPNTPANTFTGPPLALKKTLDSSGFGQILEGVGDDAAVIQLTKEIHSMHTVDYFKAGVLDIDPYVFGQVSAIHCISDIHAMGISRDAGDSVHVNAVSMCCIQSGSDAVMAGDFSQVMSGARQVLQRNNCTIVGGHTIHGNEMSLGFAVNAFTNGSDTVYWLKNENKRGNSLTGGDSGSVSSAVSAAKPGHVLVLTKPLGTGIIQGAIMRNMCRGDWYHNTIECMRSDANGAVVCDIQAMSDDSSAQVSACTDVTGFGLVGHLLEMLGDNSITAAELDILKIPILPGALELAHQHVYSSLFPKNLKAYHKHVCGLRLKVKVDEEMASVVARSLQSTAETPATAPASIASPDFCIFDPQTSGGLLLAMDGSLAKKLAEKRADCFIIGKVLDGKPGERRVKLKW